MRNFLNIGGKVFCNLWILFALAIFQSSCAEIPHLQPEEIQGSSASIVPCPSEDFLLFFQTFSDSEWIQQSFTEFPLVEKYYVDAEPEPKTVFRTIYQNQAHFPMIPLRKEREKIPLEIRIVNISGNEASVDISKPDSDAYQIRYFFEKKECWKLIRIEDSSL